MRRKPVDVWRRGYSRCYAHFYRVSRYYLRERIDALTEGQKVVSLFRRTFPIWQVRRAYKLCYAGSPPIYPAIPGIPVTLTPKEQSVAREYYWLAERLGGLPRLSPLDFERAQALRYIEADWFLTFVYRFHRAGLQPPLPHEMIPHYVDGQGNPKFRGIKWLRDRMAPLCLGAESPLDVVLDIWGDWFEEEY